MEKPVHHAAATFNAPRRLDVDDAALTPGGVRTLKVALFAADGVEGASINALCMALFAAGAVPCVIAPQLSRIRTVDGAWLEASVTLDRATSGQFEALVLPDGEAGVTVLAQHRRTHGFIDSQYHQGKTILVLGASRRLLTCVGAPAWLASGEARPGIVLIAAGCAGTASVRFLAALERQRYQRATQYDDDEA